MRERFIFSAATALEYRASQGDRDLLDPPKTLGDEGPAHISIAPQNDIDFGNISPNQWSSPVACTITVGRHGGTGDYAAKLNLRYNTSSKVRTNQVVKIRINAD